jgi:uncharacterized protein YukE
MALAFEVAVAAALLLVALSFAGVALGRVGERALLALTALLAVLAALGAAAVGINVIERFADTDLLLLAVAGLAAAAVAEGGLFGLARGLRALRNVAQVGDEARARLADELQTETHERQRDMERMLARERAQASHLLGEQERALAEERRMLIDRQAERARVELTEAVASVQQRLERRLMAWAADLDRGQRELETKLAGLSHRQGDVVASYDARLTADAERLAAASEEQRVALTKLRQEFQRLASEAFEEGRGEIELHASERRRALHEVSERLRVRERTLREQVEREESEVKGRITAGVAELERRQLAQLDRAFERAATRLVEAAERRFDAQIKESRERAAERLGRELDKGIEQFVRQAEKDVADRIAAIARTTADRLHRRIEDTARAAEVQHDLGADRVRMLSDRLEEALSAAEERAAALEAELERATGAYNRE